MSAAELSTVPAMPVASSTASQETLDLSRWHALRAIPLRLSVDIPLPAMSLRALGALRPGQVLCSTISTADDLTVEIGGAPVCQARFESIDGRMAMRMTRLLGAARTGA